MINIIPTKFFERDFAKLYKKYKSIIQDIEKLKDILQKKPRSGKSLGNSCYKIRLKNSDINRGKSAGYRVITYVIKDDYIYLLSIYSKGEKDTISDKEIIDIIKDENL